eukprot:jgi/Chrzof1/5603/Cz16g08240.t1
MRTDFLLHTDTQTQVVETELPDTAASMRLSGLELSDCVQEVGELSDELTSGLRASARLLSATEQGIKQAPALVGSAVTGLVLPTLARKESDARGKHVAGRFGRGATSIVLLYVE